MKKLPEPKPSSLPRRVAWGLAVVCFVVWWSGSVGDPPASEAVWQVVAPDGTVSSVFLERGCEDAAVNAMVVKGVQRARVVAGGKACSGTVAVNYGYP